jgi:Arc/MetJ-type ribon-helix-helix transcriptional regulator
VKHLKQISAKIDDDTLDWLTDQVRAGRFASVSHGIRYALRELMKKEGGYGKI